MHKGRLAQERTNPFTRKWLSHTHHNGSHLSHLFKKHISTAYNPTYMSAVRSCQDAPSPCFQWPKHKEPYDEPRAFWFLFCTCHKFRKQYPEASHFVSRQMPLVLELLAITKENITISAAPLEKVHAKNLQILNIGHLVFKNFSPVLECQIAGTRF